MAPREKQEELERVELEDQVTGDYLEISRHMYEALRGDDNLVFANRRRDVEIYADLLRRRSERERAPVEFFPHHGSLSKELREHVEARLNHPTQRATAVCTSTLEMGIDIRSVKSVAQVGSPPSVSALRQRLGRSGRAEGEPSVLRVYVAEDQVDVRTPPQDAIRAELFQSLAMLELILRDHWCEPPEAGALHLSYPFSRRVG